MPSLQRRTGKLKKEHFLCCGRFHSVAVAFRNTETRREDETKGPNRQRNKTLLEKHLKTKHQSLTSLASIRLVPGADRVVGHICIQCIVKCNFFCRNALQVAVLFLKRECRCRFHFSLCRCHNFV